MKNSDKLHINSLYRLLEITDRQSLQLVAKSFGTTGDLLAFHNDNMLFPSGILLDNILRYTGCSELELKLNLGIIDRNTLQWIKDNSRLIADSFPQQIPEPAPVLTPCFQTDLGKLYQNDCIDLMKILASDSVDLIFADPPFNLNKVYASGIDDCLSEEAYIEWLEQWLLECARILAPGGSLFVYNIPYWQSHISGILNNYLKFRHWITLYIRGLMPIARKLNPSHYGLLYYCKGNKPKTFNQQRIPMATCRHCGGEIHDYGGKKKGLNPNGLSIADVWTDIHPVRHKKFKKSSSNELPLNLLHRVISLASNEGDLVLDPFGGSGTTYIVAEYLKRRWIGSEIGDTDVIIDRFKSFDTEKALLEQLEAETNTLFTEKQIKLRKKNGFWLSPKDFL